MQRLVLAVLFVAIVVAVVALSARVLAGVARGGPVALMGAVQPWRTGMVERIAYIVLLGVILGTATGWLGDL